MDQTSAPAGGKRILITHSDTLLGQKLYDALRRRHEVFRLESHMRSAKVYTEPARLDRLFQELRPEVVFLLPGVPDADACEQDRERAFSENVRYPRSLCRACRDYGAKAVLLSSDRVFSGVGDRYPSDPISPDCCLGENCVQAEAAAAALGQSLIVRAPVAYGFNEQDPASEFIGRFYDRLTHQEPVALDNVQPRYPVLADELALALASLLERQGIVHLSPETPVTPYQWGIAAADAFGLDRRLVEAVPDPELTPAVRLRDSAVSYPFCTMEEGAAAVRDQRACALQFIYRRSPQEHYRGVNIGAFRYQLGQALGGELAPGYVAAADCVVPIPTTGIYYAMGLAERLQKPYTYALMKSDVTARSLGIADAARREAVIRRKIRPIPELIAGKRILLVDEAVFSGLTTRIACQMLRECGAADIRICIPVPRNNCLCHCHVLPPQGAELRGLGDRALAASLGADGIRFLSDGAFTARLEDNGLYVCRRCFGP